MIRAQSGPQLAGYEECLVSELACTTKRLQHQQAVLRGSEELGSAALGRPAACSVGVGLEAPAEGYSNPTFSLMGGAERLSNTDGGQHCLHSAAVKAHVACWRLCVVLVLIRSSVLELG